MELALSVNHRQLAPLALRRIIEFCHWLSIGAVVLQAYVWTHYGYAYTERIAWPGLMQASVLLFALSIAVATIQHQAEDFQFDRSMNMAFANRAFDTFFFALTASIACGVIAIGGLPWWCYAFAIASPIVTLLVSPGIQFLFEDDLLANPLFAIWGMLFGIIVFMFSYQLSKIFGPIYGVGYFFLGVVTVVCVVLMARTERQEIHLFESVINMVWILFTCVLITKYA